MARWWRRDAVASNSTPLRPPGNPHCPRAAGPRTRATGGVAGRASAAARGHRHSPVAPADAFAQTLATWQNPSFLQPLGHAVDPEGPAGHVDGLAVPAAPRTVSGGADLPVATRVPAGTATVQRAAGPWLGFAGPPTAVGPDAASGEPFPGSGFTADAWQEPRTLSVASVPRIDSALTVAPELPVWSSCLRCPRLHRRVP